MKRPSMQFNDALRKVQADGTSPIGFLPSLAKKVRQVASDVEGLELRLRRRLSDGEPAGIVARRLFAPEAETFNFDFLQDNSSSAVTQYVMRDAVTYEIPITFPPPGFFVARYMIVKMYQRTFDNVNKCVQQLPVLSGNQMERISNSYPNLWGLDQTPKFSFPTELQPTGGGQPYSAAQLFARRCNFFWNMLDAKSGRQIADALIPDQVLLPQAMGVGATPPLSFTGSATGFVQSFSNGRFEFPVPWLFERDGQATFFFRPITPILQPAATDSAATHFLENGKIDMSVTLQIELHGSRYLTMRDVMKLGADFHEAGVTS